MARILIWIIQVAILCLIGWAIAFSFGIAVAFSVLFGLDVLWLLGMRVETSARMDKLDLALFEAISEMRSGKDIG